MDRRGLLLSLRVLGRFTHLQAVSLAFAGLALARDSALYIPYDGQLVRMRGQVVGLGKTSREQTVLSNDAGMVFPVKLHKKLASDFLSLSPGSLVQFTGICSADTNKNGDPESFQILARSPADLRVLAEVRHERVEESAKSFRISSGYGRVCTTFLVGSEVFGNRDAEQVE
ncbi:MAG: hypothetical protein ACJ73N_07100 [Bryobacteraceae bacterium]